MKKVIFLLLVLVLFLSQQVVSARDGSLTELKFVSGAENKPGWIPAKDRINIFYSGAEIKVFHKGAFFLRAGGYRVSRDNINNPNNQHDFGTYNFVGPGLAFNDGKVYYELSVKYGNGISLANNTSADSPWYNQEYELNINTPNWYNLNVNATYNVYKKGHSWKVDPDIMVWDDESWFAGTRHFGSLDEDGFGKDKDKKVQGDALRIKYKKGPYEVATFYGKQGLSQKEDFYGVELSVPMQE